MPRTNRPRRAVRASSARQEQEPGPLDAGRILGGLHRVERAGDGEWMVRLVSPAAARKTYSCPGCGGSIPPGMAHLVVWQQDWILGDAEAIAARRHWHSACWRGRSFRRR
ncbi:hypothetical protein [Psychromicrobium xiongbiense]|uniref:hypothetical protein n=1 Tax=Psychromicrobium xiongbiense TaxID=3051184 RepID=UPI002555E6D2|nr:hypothetical protein [Psychromicrobium sp. YIM S02556]